MATRNTDTSVVVFWGACKDVKYLVGYYVEYSEVGTDVWIPCNNKPVKQTRYVQVKETVAYGCSKPGDYLYFTVPI